MNMDEDTAAIELDVQCEKTKRAEQFSYDNPVAVGDERDEGYQDDEEDDEDDVVEVERSANVIEEADRMQYGVPLESETRKRKRNKYSNALKTLKPFRGNKNKDEIPVGKAGFFSYMTYTWLTPLMTKARQGGVELHNIWKMPKLESASGNVDRLEKLWEEELKSKGTARASFQSTWFRFIRTRFLVSCCVFMVCLAAQVVSSAFIVETILNYLEIDKSRRKLWIGLVLAAAMLVAEVFRAVFYGATWLVMYQAGIRLRGAVVTLMYRHLVRLKSMGGKSMGELVNICVNDSQRLFDATAFLTQLIGGPLALCVSVGYGYYIMGPWSLLGNFIFVLFFPIQMGISKLTTMLRAKLTVVSDNRVKKMNEIITGIKLIKMYAWEIPFSKRLIDTRREERQRIQKVGFVQSMSSTITPFVPILATVCTFVGHTLSGNDLTATQAFTVVNLYIVLRNAVTIVPTCVRNFAEARVSCFRLKSFLLMDQRSHEAKSSRKGKIPIQINGASFSWTEQNDISRQKPQNNDHGEGPSPNGKQNGARRPEKCDTKEAPGSKPVLSDIYVDIKKGEVVGVCGTVGSGKSSLLSAIMGQLTPMADSGEVHVSGDIAYASQSPWIFNASVRDNIVFGSEFDESWYNQVVFACCLTEDFNILPNGDQTEIGERGSNLSGGQKQRVNLARAVYSRRDVVLCDDPLSAVDVHVGEHIFQHCILGLLKGKTVVLVTHQLQYLDRCSTVMYMEDGQIVEQGSHASLMADGNTYSQMMTKWQPSDIKTADDTGKKGAKGEAPPSGPKGEKGASGNRKEGKGKGGLVQAEKKRSGGVQSSVYVSYIRACGGWCLTIFVLLLFVTYIGCTSFSNWFLSYWIRQGSGQMDRHDFITENENISMAYDNDHDIFRRSVDNMTAAYTRSISSTTQSPNFTANPSDGQTTAPFQNSTSNSTAYQSTGLSNTNVPVSKVPIVSGGGNQTSTQPLTLNSTSTVSTTASGSTANLSTSPSSPLTDVTTLAPQATTTMVVDTTSGTQSTRITTRQSVDTEAPTSSSSLKVTTEGMTTDSPTVQTTTEARTTLESEITTTLIPSTAKSETTTELPSAETPTVQTTSQEAGTETQSTEPSEPTTQPTSAYTTTTSSPAGSGSIKDNPHLARYVMVYGLTAVVMLGIGVLKGIVYVKTTLRASHKLHKKMYLSVLRSPMSFFDTNPVGRIINRFSKDMDEVDSRLPFFMETFLHQALLILAALVIICLTFPFFLIAVIPLSVAFVFLNVRSIVGIRQLKRLDNISRSPLLSQLTSTVEGLHVIQAFNKEKEMEKKFNDVLDANSVPFFLFNCAMRWFTLRLDIISVVLTTSVAFVVVLTCHYADNIDAALAGLALSYAIQMSGYFQFTIRLKSEVEARFTSVERLQEYTKLEQEAPEIILKDRPKRAWPTEGHVIFDHLDMRYRDNLPLTLNDLSFEARPGEKVGIVGRTGAGKSSICVSLFRLAEAAGGKVVIDGIDISKVGLRDLRAQLSVIPQDPVLFAGTIRYNLDPNLWQPEDRIWSALESVHMKDKIIELPQKLESEVADNGRNFSVGERQLLCMARVLLMGSKVLLLDEATAAIDTQTDAKIQATIRESFKECTILMIAHRLNTVIDSDKIILMDQGKIVEMGSPKELLDNPSSKFSGMMGINATEGEEDDTSCDEDEDTTL